MSKTIVLKDLLLNFDYAGVVEKSYVPEEVTKLSVSLLRTLLENTDELDYVCLLGDLFEEETLMVDEIDEFVEMVKGYEEIKFLVVPMNEIDEKSWYNIINWPDNVVLMTEDENSFKDYESEVVFYYGEPEKTIFDLEYSMVNLSTIYKQEFSTFLPRTYTFEEMPSYCLVDTNKGHIELMTQKELRLKSISLELEGSESVDDMVKHIDSEIEEGRCYYQIIIKGLVKKEIAYDLEALLQEHINENMECIIYNQSFKNYDVDSIKKINKDNLIGIFINNVEEGQMTDQEKKRIIETGLDYLL